MTQKDLQKVTEKQKKFNLLMSKKKIEQSDIKAILNKKEIASFQDYLANQISKSGGDSKHDLLEKISALLPTYVKNQLWESNHHQMSVSISKYIETYGTMPPKNRIAADTGLSRQTIHKHFKEYATHPFYVEQMQQFKFMNNRVLAKVLKIAVEGKGDVKAARLYLEVIGCLGNQCPSGTSINTQNNYIQINGTVLSQETIKHLDQGQLNAIESILKTTLPPIPNTGQVVKC